MNHFQREERRLGRAESDYAALTLLRGARMIRDEITVVTCDDCGGTGRDEGSLNAYEPEACKVCNGSGNVEYEPAPNLFARLSIEEQLVASIAVESFRKGKAAA